jgi:hypothetical protein
LKCIIIYNLFNISMWSIFSLFKFE